jgi:hypothetical protein
MGEGLESFELIFFHDPLMPAEYGDKAVEALQSAADALPLEAIAVDRKIDKVVVKVEYQDQSRGDEISDALSKAFFSVFPHEEPVIYEDPVLGKLVFDSDARQFEGMIELDGKRLAVNVQSNSGEVDTEQINALRSVIDRLPTQLPHYYDLLTDSFLALYNDSWKRRDERAGAEPLTAAEFKERLSLSYIEVDDTAQVTIEIDEDGMFTEHALYVELPRDGSVEVRLW